MAARRGGVAVLVLLAGVSLAGCRSSSPEPEAEADGGATVTEVAGQDGIFRVELTADAARHIDLRTATVSVRAAGSGGVPGRLSVPLSAVLYDNAGATWVYAGVGTLAFQRVPITLGGVQGEQAVLTAGPAAGTQVATVGAVELLGAEEGVPGE